MEGVKNLVVKRHNLPVTKIVEELMEIKAGQVQDQFRYFDPKILRATNGHDSNIPRAKNPFQEAIVFMVGGGNYIEYQVIKGHKNQHVSSSLRCVAELDGLYVEQGQLFQFVGRCFITQLEWICLVRSE